jgi:hypothetical protein
MYTEMHAHDAEDHGLRCGYSGARWADAAAGTVGRRLGRCTPDVLGSRTLRPFADVEFDAVALAKTVAVIGETSFAFTSPSVTAVLGDIPSAGQPAS